MIFFDIILAAAIIRREIPAHLQSAALARISRRHIGGRQRRDVVQRTDGPFFIGIGRFIGAVPGPHDIIIRCAGDGRSICYGVSRGASRGNRENGRLRIRPCGRAAIHAIFAHIARPAAIIPAGIKGQLDDAAIVIGPILRQQRLRRSRRLIHNGPIIIIGRRSHGRLAGAVQPIGSHKPVAMRRALDKPGNLELISGPIRIIVVIGIHFRHIIFHAVNNHPHIIGRIARYARKAIHIGINNRISKFGCPLPGIGFQPRRVVGIRAAVGGREGQAGRSIGRHEGPVHKVQQGAGIIRVGRPREAEGFRWPRRREAARAIRRLGAEDVLPLRQFHRRRLVNGAISIDGVLGIVREHIQHNRRRVRGAINAQTNERGRIVFLIPISDREYKSGGGCAIRASERVWRKAEIRKNRGRVLLHFRAFKFPRERIAHGFAFHAHIRVIGIDPGAPVIRKAEIIAVDARAQDHMFRRIEHIIFAIGVVQVAVIFRLHRAVEPFSDAEAGARRHAIRHELGIVVRRIGRGRGGIQSNLRRRIARNAIALAGRGARQNLHGLAD